MPRNPAALYDVKYKAQERGGSFPPRSQSYFVIKLSLNCGSPRQFRARFIIHAALVFPIIVTFQRSERLHTHIRTKVPLFFFFFFFFPGVCPQSFLTTAFCGRAFPAATLCRSHAHWLFLLCLQSCKPKFYPSGGQ